MTKQENIVFCFIGWIKLSYWVHSENNRKKQSRVWSRGEQNVKSKIQVWKKQRCLMIVEDDDVDDLMVDLLPPGIWAAPPSHQRYLPLG